MATKTRILQEPLITLSHTLPANQKAQHMSILRYQQLTYDPYSNQKCSVSQALECSVYGSVCAYLCRLVSGRQPAKQRLNQSEYGNVARQPEVRS